MIRKTTARVLTGAGLMLAASIILTGCANPLEKALESVASSAADNIVSGATGTDIQGVASAEIPDDFPKNIPLPDATPINAAAITTDGERGWMIQYQGRIDDAAYDDAVAAIVASGFSEDESSNINGVMNLSLLSNAEHSVTVSLMGPADEERILQIMVSTYTR